VTNQQLTRQAIKTLNLRIASYQAELETCTTEAMRKCVMQQIEIAEQQLASKKF
jgi:hypothetical protein